MPGNRLFNLSAFLSLLLCLFSGLIAFGNYRVFVEGTIATVNGKDQIVHEPELKHYAQLDGAICAAFAVLPLIWFFAGISR